VPPKLAFSKAKCDSNLSRKIKNIKKEKLIFGWSILEKKRGGKAALIGIWAIINVQIGTKKQYNIKYKIYSAISLFP
jgi:hypothetical protein